MILPNNFFTLAEGYPQDIENTICLSGETLDTKMQNEKYNH